jgi:superfamily II DNA or RNA helicase
MIKLRPWQERALQQSLDWLLEKKTDRHFLINAAPGSGKTIAACAIANALLARDVIDRIIVIAPRSEVVNQWAQDFSSVVQRTMLKVTSADGDIAALDVDVCATWAAIQGLSNEFKKLCTSQRTLVICDEHHHAAIEAAWGSSADSAFADATFVLVLTGTPIRSDGKKSVWLAYDDAGAIDHPEEGTYTLTYGSAVDLEYCRPVTFHRHEGLFNVDLEGGEVINISSKRRAELTPELKRIPGLQRALNFYALACTPQYEKDGKTPLRAGYQGSMLDAASQQLAELRDRMPNAGGLVIAPSIEIAKYFVSLIELVEGETPILVHSQMLSADKRIDAFRRGSKRWLVSVAMVSEGVDIPRLRVLIYLSSSLTELAFRQAIGRVVRTDGPNDDTYAYVVMPSFNVLEEYALRIENEMPPRFRDGIAAAPKNKRCPVCLTECELGAKVCESCHHEFPKRAANTRECPVCHALNPIAAKKCNECSHSFAAEFHLSLEDALRAGVIVRGMDIDEDEAREGEGMAKEVRDKILRSGDEKLLRILRTLPEASWARLKNIMEQ